MTEGDAVVDAAPLTCELSQVISVVVFSVLICPSVALSSPLYVLSLYLVFAISVPYGASRRPLVAYGHYLLVRGANRD